MFKQTFLLTDEDKRKLSEMCGNTILWVLEGRSITYMCERLNMPPWEIEHNIDEMLYILRKKVGKRRFIKTLFIK